MSEGYEHTSGNQVNIQIKLCVHPNIISKGTKAWIIRSFKGCNLARLQKKGYLGSIEFKWPNIREHSFYSHSKDKFKRIPLILNKPLVFKHDTPWSWQLILFLNFSFFFFFFIMYTFLFFFFLYLQTMLS